MALILASAAAAPPPSWALVNSVKTEDNSGSQTTSISITVNGTTAGNLLIALHRAYTTGGVSLSVTSDNGTTFSAATDQAIALSSGLGRLYYGVNAASGSVTITGHSNGIVYITLIIAEFSGADPGVSASGANTIDNAGTNIVSTISTSAPTTQANQLVVSSVVPSSGSLVSIGPNQQIILDEEFMSYEIVASPAAVTHTYTHSEPNQVGAVIAAFG